MSLLTKALAFTILALAMPCVLLADQPESSSEKESDSLEYFSDPTSGVSLDSRPVSYPQPGLAAHAEGPCTCEGGCSNCQGGAGSGQNSKKNPCASSHKILFFNNDFSYLNDADYRGHCLGDSLKQMDVCCCGKLDIGGQWRLRYHHEIGMNKGAQRFLDTRDDFLLNRLRLYANYQMNEDVRFYVEGIYADSYFESRPPRNIEVNEGDFLNYFVDLKLADDWTVRAGREQLLYGAERLVSPLDWANTMRTFEGIKLMWRPTDWSVDFFYTNLVPPLPYELDRVDYNQRLYGAWATYNGLCDATIDLYQLGHDNQQVDSSLSLQTTGARLYGKTDEYLYELQGGYQYGDALGVNTGSQSAGFVTAGLGKNLQACWDPTLWVYFDYASEDFNQLFPLSHKYFGYIDAVQRSNIVSPNVLLTAKPNEKISLLLWYYYFLSASDGPVLSIGGTPNQNTDRDFGQELDFTVKYQCAPRSDLLAGYSHFWRGEKILNPSDADFVYVQWTLNF
jgi:hypothetical protein